jgi:ribosomal-protein-alanine N-acetyltransferase
MIPLPMMVRQMTASDVDRVFDIANRSLEEKYIGEVFLLFMNLWPAGQIVAADELGNVIGFISGSRASFDKASIQVFAVDRKHRGRGAGSRLLDEFKFRAAMEGMHFIQLEVKDDAAAVSFYEKKGFAAIAFMDDFYNSGAGAVRMMCSLRGNV